MSDYIEREAALQKIESCAGWPRPLESAYEEIQDMPAADVAPVRHGRWEDVFQDGPCSWSGKCSRCRVRNDIPPLLLAHYCPNCGARMDKEN